MVLCVVFTIHAALASMVLGVASKTVTVCSASVPVFDCQKPYATPDYLLTTKPPISSLVRSANFEPRHVSSSRHLLSTDATVSYTHLTLPTKVNV